ncbi:hypothetical protein [Variovorax sp. CCNWLW235]|uniref:hypothetical protein n=1 Tax=Variovorax sp. CCNWLW235 TaxID=3127463 RepID=UPI00307749C4
MTEPKFDKSSTVQIGKIFLFSEGSITAIAHGGSFEVNAAILSTAMPRQRIDTVEVFSDGPSAVVSGIKHGAASASVGISSATLIAGRIVSAATVVGGFNDAINVGQHVVQGNGAETATEGLGVAGQASGAAAGAKAFGTAGSALGGPFVGAIGALVGGGFGAFVGAQGAKSLGAYLTGGDTPDKLGPPLTLPNDTALTPAVTTSDGSQYALVQIEGKYTWFSIQDNPALPSRYVEVVSGARAAELTGSYLRAAGFESQLAQARAEVAQQQREALREAFARSEIQSTNSMGLNGLLWGTPSAIGANATQTWARSPEPGQALNILDVRNADGSASRIVQEVDRARGELLGEKTYENHSASPDGFRLVATSDYQSGVHWTLNRETGVMEQAGGTPAKAGGPSVEDGFAPDGSPLGQAATVIHEGRAHTTIWARDDATGHYTETETITRRDGAGNVTQSATAVRNYAADGTELQSAAPQNPAPNEEGSVHVIPGSFRTPAPAQAPAQQEPIPQITTHESRIVPTPGGMSFAEAHRRRDEPEQISPGSLRPVGKLDTSQMDKSSPLYRMHLAQEQAHMRDLEIALAQDRERFKNEPKLPQPSVERTQERAQDHSPRRLLEEAPVAQAHVSAARPAAGAEAMHSPTTHASVAAPVHSNPQGDAATIAAAQAQVAAAQAQAAAAQAQAVAAQAELAATRQQMARMAAERGHDGLARWDERDERDQRDQPGTTQLAQGRDSRQDLEAGTHGKQISAAAVPDTSRPLLREFSDPSHPQNALYSTLKDLLPKGTSEERLAQGTAACHRSRITEKDLSGIYIGDTSVVFASRSLFAVPAQMDISQPAPNVQQSDQHILRTDQQREQIMSEIRTQAAAQANQQQGPVMGGR